ncbi:MAG TPA: protease pro-enzyme activation domain-containing protein, partial [Actinomycetota bacterium]|nr:protease pro-enzyme activation domain-containing protein [Actinomycetota bacterium]
MVVALVAASLVVGVSPSLGAASPATAPVGGAPALPAGAILQGATAEANPLQLVVALQPTDPAGLADMATAVSTPGSPEYHQYLTTA